MAETRAPAAVVAPDNGERLTLDQWVEFFKFKSERDSPSEARNALLVIAVLITTATYQAVLSPPGGLWQDNGDKETRVIGQEAGKTIFGTNGLDYRFFVFIITNTAGFIGSLLLIVILTEGFPLQLELGFTILALVLSYDSAMISIIPDGTFGFVFLTCSILFPVLLHFAAKKVRQARNLRLKVHNICDIC